MSAYDHKAIEKKWQKKWEEGKAFEAKDAGEKEYLLIEFPYPSGEGLHVGHIRSWTALDVVARKRRAQGKNVLYPIGWDAFGLPTENYALKTGKDPRLVTKENTDNFRRQIKSLGISFDWSREVNTTDPAYYKWTQWIFLKLYEKGLAYKAKTLINWCPKDKIGLANEEVVDGKCERCDTPVEKREKEQWMLAITKYAQRLYDDLDTVDYIPAAKMGQRNWIGPSEGAEIEFDISNSDKKIKIFTTRPDTLFGATYMVLAPEHPLIETLLQSVSNKDEVVRYIEQSRKKTEIERTAEGKEKTGVEIKGVKAINPANKEEIPVWVADYVLGGYGTGAIMAVPAHDERDFEFSKKYNLHSRKVVSPKPLVSVFRNAEDVAMGVKSDLKIVSDCWIGEGELVNSGEFDGLDSEDAKKKIIEFVGGKMITTYKLRDWVFSRQRYWGEPIPMIKCENCNISGASPGGWVPVLEKDLPVLLPEVKKYQPSETGESPLANIKEFVDTACPKCGGPAKRETDVMPNWAGSSWYYLRYADPHNDKRFASKEKLKYWTPVDWYNGGMEHTTLHLLYSRFWHKVLFDLKLVPTSEPYTKRTSHGLILAGDDSKMSKSKGNIINPDTLVEAVGADSLRLFEMFLGPFDQPVSWNSDSIAGVRRFLEKVWNLAEKVKETPLKKDTDTLLAQTIDKVSRDIDALKMNTAVSSLMIFLNHLQALEAVPKEVFRQFLGLLAPFAPHIAHELAEQAGFERAQWEVWPALDSSKLLASTVTIGVQVNGKVRTSIELSVKATEEEALTVARANPTVAKWLAGGKEKKAIYVPGKIINFVLEPS